MDRNLIGQHLINSRFVALRKESVDRNSSREVNICIAGEVALRKESVDRNKRSPTAGQLGAVALRKESVDRNTNDRRYCIAPVSRSPQGERG